MYLKILRPTTVLKFLFLFLVFQQLHLSVSAQMRKIFLDESKPDNAVVKFSFYTASEGYVAFRDGLGYTVDSGRTFIKKKITLANVDYNGYPVNLTFGFGINGVKAFDKNTLLVYGDYGLVPAILHSTNGGNTFKVIYHSQYDPWTFRTGIRDMVFPENTKIGYAVDADRILRTADFGLTWRAIRTDPGSYFDHIEAINDQNFVAFARSTRKLLKSYDGFTFYELYLPYGQTINYASFITQDKGWINTTDDHQRSSTYYSSNGGFTWKLQNDPRASSFGSGKMKFINDSTGYALSGLYEVYKTTDSGKIWQRLPRDNSFTYLGYSHNDLYVADANTLLAGGGHGFIERCTNGGGDLYPGSFFRIDTINHLQTGIVNLVNYSKSGYKYQWFVNDTLIGNSYHVSYNHRLRSVSDKIMLIVTSGNKSDTSIQYQMFYPPVIISSFTPQRGGTGTAITITGENFSSVTGVYFGGVKAGFALQSSTSIRATVGAGASGTVLITTSSGYGSLEGFIFIPPPTISSFSPAKVRSGEPVTITGSNFDSVIAVSFGGVAAASYTVVSPTVITARPAAGSSGTVQVKTIGGTVSKDGFTLLPVINSISPLEGTYGTHMTILGTGLGDVKSVSVGGVPVLSFKVNSFNSVTAVVGAGASGDIVINTSSETATKTGFTYYEPPVITSFNPMSGPIGTKLTLSGNNFNPVAGENVVYFGAVKAKITAATANSITVEVPPGTSFESISVTTHYLTAYSKEPFIVTFPNAGSITPASFTHHGVSIGASKYPMDAVPADFDGDGRPDLAVSNSDDLSKSGLVILRNTGTANTVSFTVVTEYSAFAAGGIAVGDVDGDGKIDVAVSDEGRGFVHFYRNTSTPGNISFSEPLKLATATDASALNLKDLDGDGKPDIMFYSWWEHRFVIHRNISNPGEMAFAPRFDIYASVYRNVVVEDLNGDTKPEIIVADGFILKNNCTRGNLNFEMLEGTLAYVHSYIAAGDIDGDGKKDLISGNHYSSRLAVFRNTGTGSNLSFDGPKEFNAAISPVDLAVTDFDGDGKPDVGFALTNKNFAVLKNTSSPGQVDFAPQINYTGNTYSVGDQIAIADINLDGKPDAVSISERNRPISVFINNTKPEPFIESFSPTIGVQGTVITITGVNFTNVSSVSIGGLPAASFTVNSTTSITAVVADGNTGDVRVASTVGEYTKAGFVFGYPPAITDFNPKNGKAGSSIVITGKYFNSVPTENTVYLGTVKATITAASTTSLTVTVPNGVTYGPVSVVTGGLSAFDDRPFVPTFTGGPGFTPASFNGGKDYSNWTSTKLGDIDGDGKLDLTGYSGQGKLKVGRNISTGDSVTFATVAEIPYTINYFSLGDINSDGKLDIVATRSDPNNDHYITIMLNNSSPGMISFGTRQDYFVINSYRKIGAVVIIDLDKDGKPDIVYSDYDSHNVGVIKNLSRAGTFAFAPPITYNTYGYATGVQVSDVDNDGNPDLIASVNSAEQIALFLNKCTPGTIHFEAAVMGDVGSWPTSVAVGDLDGDGKKDFAVPNVNGGGFSVIRNLSTPGKIMLAAKIDFPVKFRPDHISITDLDGDGKADLTVMKESSDFIYSDAFSASVFRNISTPGNIALDAPVDYDAGNLGYYTQAGDLNDDGRPEMVAVRNGATRIYTNQLGLATTVKICPNSDTSIISSITGTKYQWQENKGTGFTDIADNSYYTGSAKIKLSLAKVPASWNKYQYRCVVNDNQRTPIYQLSIEGTSVTPTAKVIVSSTTVCAGAEVLFRARITAGGSHPTYQWLLNGSPVGNNDDTLRLPGVQNGDKISVRLTSNETCAMPAQIMSDTVSMTVLSLVPQVKITPSMSTMCPGNTIIFYSEVINGGPRPAYQWYKSGNKVGTNIDSYFSSDLTDNDSVYVIITSTAECASPLTGRSNSVRIRTAANAFPQIVINGNTSVEERQSSLISTEVKDGGSTPVYQWQDSTASHNWQNIQWATQSSLNYSPQNSGDKLRCELRTGLPCASSPTTFSNTLVFSVDKLHGQPGIIMPNPVLDMLNIDSLQLRENWQILDVVNLTTGQTVLTRSISNQTRISIPVAGLAPGLYAAVLKRNGGSNGVLRFVKM